MQKRIIINSAELETRIALVEGSQLAELQVQGRGEGSIAGNIFRGRVVRVLPGMQAAFVDLGLEKAAFMHVSDFWSAPGDGQVEGGSGEIEDLREEIELDPSLAAYVDELEAGPEPAISPEQVEILPETPPSVAAPANEDESAGENAGFPQDALPAAEPVDSGVRSLAPAVSEATGQTRELDVVQDAAEEQPTGSGGRGRRRSRRRRRGRGGPARREAATSTEVGTTEISDSEPAEGSGSDVGPADPEDQSPEIDVEPPVSSRPRRGRRAAVEDFLEEEDEGVPTLPRPPIEELLTKGQEILVQISKEPIGSKGARITSHISLPGRYIVYMPTTDHVGVSRRIEDEKERQRLREIVTAGRGKTGGGFIVRTACEGVSKREILADMRFLSKLWASILKKAASAPAPSLLHEDLDMVQRAMRDLFTTDVTEVVVDKPSDHQRIIDFVDSVLQPRLKSRVKLYEETAPIFDHFGIETQVNRALERRVWLKSGGYLVFDQTEALTTIDVNTGRFVGKTTQEETVLKTNLEAARVAIDQLRLRNIGGIIIIDFIDMDKAAHRKKVSEALAEAVKRDKARTNILRISELGLVQMTRKRTRENLRQLMTVGCPTCAGEGCLRSIEALAADALRAVRRACAGSPDAAAVRLRLPIDVGQALRGPLSSSVEELGARLGVRLSVEVDERMPRTQSEVHLSRGHRPAAANSPPEGTPGDGHPPVATAGSHPGEP